MNIKKGVGISVGSLMFTLILMGLLVGISFYLNHGTQEREHASFKSLTGNVIKESTTPYTARMTTQRSEIEQILRGALVDAIKEVESHGGYLVGETDSYFPNKTVDFRGETIPVYRACDNIHYPSLDDIRNKIWVRFVGLANHRLLKYAQSIPEMEFKGANLNLTILDGKIVSSGDVYMYYKGNLIPSDYYITVPTKLKEIYEYATSFSKFTKETRLLDYLFIYTLYKAKEHYFPTRDVMTKCGEHITLDRFQLSNNFMDLYYYFLANVNLNVDPQKAKDYKLADNDPLFFVLSKIIKENKLKYDKYLQSVELYAPDDFFFVFPKGVDVINNEPVLKVVVPIGDKCVKYYDIEYSFPFEYVIGIKDDYVSDDTYFYFAEYSYIDKMTPSSCSYDDLPDNTHVLIPGLKDAETYADELKENVGKDLGIEIKCKKEKKVVIKVVDDSGNPIKGAGVSFGNCSLGITDAHGRVVGWVEDKKAVLRVAPPSGYVGYAKKTKLKEHYRVVLPKIRKNSNVNIKYIKVITSLVVPYSDYVHNYSYMDVSAKNGYIGPNNAILELKKCEVMDAKPSDFNLSVIFSIAPIALSVDDSKKESVLYPGKTYQTSFTFKGENKGEVSLSNGRYNVLIEESRGNVMDENSNYYEIGFFNFDTSKYRFGSRSIQISPRTFKHFNIPYVVVTPHGDFGSYIVPGTSYLNIPRIATAVYLSGYSIDKFSKRLANFVYDGCGIDPFDTPKYHTYYSIRRDCDTWLEVAQDCGVQDLRNYWYFDVDTGEKICNYQNLLNAMHNLGCEVNENMKAY